MPSLLAATFSPKLLLCGHSKEVSSWKPCNHVSFRRTSTSVSIHYRKEDQFRIIDRSSLRLSALFSESGGISVVPTTTVPRKLKVRKSTRVDAHKVGPSRPHKDRRSIKQKKRKHVESRKKNSMHLESCKRKRKSRKKKDVRRIPTGVIHVQSSFNNTIVTVTDVEGRVFSWSSSGSCKFENTKKGTPFAAQTAAEHAISKAVNRGMKRAKVMKKGPGLGRDAALRAIRRSGVRISIVQDVTPMPHNGCRPTKKRRV